MSDALTPSGVRSRVDAELRLHPRVAYQSLLAEDEARRALARNLPDLTPFGDHTYHDLLAILDWDHRLPSRALILRLNFYYTAATAADGRRLMDARVEEIARRDRYPEFDVPDFEGLRADEAYETVVSPQGALERTRLVSEWRRAVRVDDAHTSTELVRRSEDFRTICKQLRQPSALGDLEAVSWCPPCESDYPRWTIDVWYLTEFDGIVGRGYSFMVDLTEATVVQAREFLVRTAETSG